MKKGQTIKTDERIFKIITFDDELILCNLQDINLSDLENIKHLWHFWNGDFKRFGKIDLKEMINNH
jgi:hypothetical protein